MTAIIGITDCCVNIYLSLHTLFYVQNKTHSTYTDIIMVLFENNITEIFLNCEIK